MESADSDVLKVSVGTDHGTDGSCALHSKEAGGGSVLTQLGWRAAGGDRWSLHALDRKSARENAIAALVIGMGAIFTFLKPGCVIEWLSNAADYLLSLLLAIRRRLSKLQETNARVENF